MRDTDVPTHLQHMSLQTSLCVPVDDGYTVYSSTQWPQLTQIAVATLLGVSSNWYSSVWLYHSLSVCAALVLMSVSKELVEGMAQSSLAPSR